MLCDDVAVEVDDEGKVVGVHNACARGNAHFRHAAEGVNESPLVRDESGELRPATLEEALDRAAGLLLEASLPLLYGWSTTTCEAQWEGLKLARALGAVIDSTASICQGHAFAALQAVGGATCTLGDVINKCDAVIYWGANPHEAHPRHVGKTAFSRGMFRISGREMKKLVTVDVRTTPTAHANDLFLQVAPGTDFEVLQALRVALRDDGSLPATLGGLPGSKWREFLDLVKQAEFPAFFFGLGLTASPGGVHNVEALLSFARALADLAGVPAQVVPMVGHANMRGACETFLAGAGVPFGASFARRDRPGSCWSQPGETTTFDLLRSGQADALLIVGADPASHLPLAVAAELRSVPVVVLDARSTQTTRFADVVIPTKRAGLEATGTAVRFDGVPVRLSAPLRLTGRDWPDDATVLRNLRERVER